MRSTPEKDKIDSKRMRVEAMTEKGELIFAKECKRLLVYLQLYQERFDTMLINKKSDSRQWNTYTDLRIHLFDPTLFCLFSFVFSKTLLPIMYGYELYLSRHFAALNLTNVSETPVSCHYIDEHHHHHCHKNCLHCLVL